MAGQDIERQLNEPVVVIPAYEPDEKMLALLRELGEHFRRVVVVDDGSTKAGNIFNEAKRYVERVLVHPTNRGKGAAIKTALNYLGEVDVITADADGQHTVKDILRIAEGLKTHRNGLVLGVRAFAGKVPLRSRFGNWWTKQFFSLLTGLKIKDTQTGLRGIPSSLVSRLSALPGERYEYEMVMLADAKHHAQKPLQLPIETIYIEDNRSSHFSPLKDTVRIYRALFRFLNARLYGK